MHAFDNNSNTNTTEVTPEKPVVLIVDDARTMRASIDRILREDFETLEAKDGDEAWEIISRKPTLHVVLSDLMMPNKNGFQLLRQIRESDHDQINQLPVIIITGHEDDARMKRQAMALGASDFISKPFDSIQIKARARSYAKHGDTNRKLEYARKILSQKTTIDDLTGLANPRFFKEHGRGLLAFAARQGLDVSVLRISIDKFDLLEKKKGKAVADKVLLNISRIIEASVRAEDSVARVEKAKFAVMMPGANEAGAKVLAGRIHRLIGNAVYKLGEIRFRMTASAGLVYQAKDQSISFEKVVELAEARLDTAIKKGGNSLVLGDIGVQGTQQDLRSIRRPITLEDALALICAGQTHGLREHLSGLLTKIYPLLEYSDKELDLGMAPVLEILSNALKQAR